MASKEENGDIVDGSTTNPESEGEAISVKARKKKVTEALLSLGIKVTKGCDPPVIAVLGSGGGLRAMIGFLGSLSKLSELKILDVVTYLGGTSGSTWCMSSLYSNSKDWSDFSCMKDLESQFCKKIKSETSRDWRKPWPMIKEIFLGDTYSLTDLWAYLLIAFTLNTINKGKLSSHKESCENGKNPYPIYSAVEKEHKRDNSRAWFEFTPHMCGFPDYKSYVKSEHLGSKFKGGNLLEKHPEKDLAYLQGMWGSACGDTPPSNLSRLLKEILHNLISFLSKEVLTSCEACQQVKKILTCNLETTKEESGIFWSETAKKLEEALKRTQGMGHCGDATPGKSKRAREEEMQSFKDICEYARVIANIVSCIAQWEWGTTNNFLYQWKSKTPAEIFNKEHICLIDAGLEINSPYPLLLLPHRKVDLILSFDFSQGDPFLTLTQAAEYCEKHKVPFPKINIEEKDKNIPSKSCYSFEGDDKKMPYVMHFPLFNTETCKDGNKVEEMATKYSTFNFRYNEAKLKDLLEIAKNNVETSTDQILVKIKQCAERCNQRLMSAV